METIQAYETMNVSPDLISRLGFRTVTHPRHFYCVRNGEALELTIHLFENKNTNKVIYYTEAKYILSGKLRHKTLFQFKKEEDHEKQHIFYLHTLFFDETMVAQFEAENTFHPSPLMDKNKSESWLNWIRSHWNTNHFENKYKTLGGLNSPSQIIHD
jgi:hypothetical protein